MFAGAKPQHQWSSFLSINGFFLVHQGRFHQHPGMALQTEHLKLWSAVTMATWHFQTLQATLLASAAVKDSGGEGPLLFLH